MLELTVKIDSKEVQELRERFPERINRGLADGVDLALSHFQRLVVDKIAAPHGQKPAAIAFGNLVNSIQVQHNPVDLFGSVVATPPADMYAAPVEFGTRPHFPPVAAIERWVVKKFGADLSRGEIEATAFAIARAISKRGTKGHFMFQRAFDEGRPQAETIIDAEIEKAVRELTQ